MNITTQKVYELLSNLRDEINRKFRQYGYNRFQFLDVDEVVLENPKDPNEVQKRNELYSIIEKLDDITYVLDYLEKPVLKSGVLQKKANGRYELEGYEFTSGSDIETLIVDPEGEEASYWEHTSVEHDGDDYYAVYRHTCLDGLEARIRG